MSQKTKVVPLGALPKVFKGYGYSHSQMNAVIGRVIASARTVGQLNISIEALKALDILDEPIVTRTMLQLEAGDPLIELGVAIGKEIADSVLTSWVVKDHVLLLEIA